jgi:hypothetical protein
MCPPSTRRWPDTAVRTPWWGVVCRHDGGWFRRR